MSFYIKTYFYAEFEIPILLMLIYETIGYVDGIFITEANITHTGNPKKLLFMEKVAPLLPLFIYEKIKYIPLFLKSSRDVKTNETRMRSEFLNQTNLKNEDVILSVDCDEIPYANYLPILYERVVREKRPFQLLFHQFFYKIQYLWKDCNFIAPTIGRVMDVKDKNWRYVGEILSDQEYGVHLSWCMDVESMVYKLQSYSHFPEYGHFAKPDILKKAIENKIYPFNPSRSFTIEVLDMEKLGYILPASYFYISSHFKHLLLTYNSAILVE